MERHSFFSFCRVYRELSSFHGPTSSATRLTWFTTDLHFIFNLFTPWHGDPPSLSVTSIFTNAIRYTVRNGWTGPEKRIEGLLLQTIYQKKTRSILSIFRWNFKKRSENARFAVSRNLLFRHIRCRGSRLHILLCYEPRKLFETK